MIIDKINKPYIVLIIVLSVVLVAVVLPACDSALYNSSGLYKVKHCPMTSLHQAQSHHLFHLKQLFSAWPSQADLWQTLTLVLVFLGTIASAYKLESPSFNYWRGQYFYNMKPWDQLRLALSQGLIHNKHLD